MTLKATLVKTISIGCMLLVAMMQNGCQSMQFGASPIPVLSHSLKSSPNH